MRYSHHPDVDALLREAVEKWGCRLEQSKHWKIFLPSGKLVVVSRSPRSPHVVRSARAELLRALKGN